MIGPLFPLVDGTSLQDLTVSRRELYFDCCSAVSSGGVGIAADDASRGNGIGVFWGPAGFSWIDVVPDGV